MTMSQIHLNESNKSCSNKIVKDALSRSLSMPSAMIAISLMIVLCRNKSSTLTHILYIGGWFRAQNPKKLFRQLNTSLVSDNIHFSLVFIKLFIPSLISLDWFLIIQLIIVLRSDVSGSESGTMNANMTHRVLLRFLFKPIRNFLWNKI